MSHSWEDHAHNEWVLDVARHLQQNGIHVLYDKWDLELGSDLPYFMESLKSADYVIMICTPMYKIKCDTRQGGVGHEGGIISGQLYTESNPNQRKYIGVLKSGSSKESIPTFYQNRMWLDFRDPKQSNEKYEELLRHLYNKPAEERPNNFITPNFLQSNSKQEFTWGRNKAGNQKKLPKNRVFIAAENIEDERMYLLIFCIILFNHEPVIQSRNNSPTEKMSTLYDAMKTCVKAIFLLETSTTKNSGLGFEIGQWAALTMESSFQRNSLILSQEYSFLFSTMPNFDQRRVNDHKDICYEVRNWFVENGERLALPSKIWYSYSDFHSDLYETKLKKEKITHKEINLDNFIEEVKNWNLHNKH